VAAPTCSTSSAYGGPYCGTSGAAPHAGGVAALVSAVDDFESSEVRNLIQETADDMSEPVNARGDGALNASAAVEAVTDDRDTDDGDGDDDGTVPEEPVVLDSPDTVLSDGSFEATVTTGEFATASVEVDSTEFDVSVSVVDGDGDAPTVVSDRRVEFIDIDESSSTYVVGVNVTDCEVGDKGEVSAYVGGDADEHDNESYDTSVFEITDGFVSPVEGVSDALWTAVTGDGELELSDLGNAIQTYQDDTDNATVDGADIGLSDLGALIQYYQNEVV